MSIDAMKLALEALENHNGNYKLSKAECVKQRQVEDALRQAIEQAQKQEPVARKKHEPTIDLDKYAGTYGGYTSPPPRQPLTDEQCDALMLALDEWARDVDHYEYGLPIYNEEHREEAREVMRAAHGIKEKNT